MITQLDFITKKFITYFIPENDPKTHILVSNTNVVFGNLTEIITSILSAQKENINFKNLCLQRLDRG